MPIRSRELQLVILGFVAFVTSFGAHVVAVNLPVYAQQVGAGAFVIGLLIAVYDFAELGAKPVFGFVADRRGTKATMLAGIAVFSIASLSFLILPPRLLLLVRFLQGLGAAALSITSAALVADYFAEGRARAFGIYNAITGAGYVLSPVLGGAIVWASSFSMIFVACFIVGAIAFVLCVGLPRANQDTGLDDDDGAFSFKVFLDAVRDRTLLPWYAIIVVNMFLVGILFGFLPVYVYSLGYNQLRNGFIVASATTSYLLVQPVAGMLADRFDALKVMRAGLVLSSLGVLLVPFTAGLALVAACVVGGVGVGAVWTNSDAMVSQLAKRGRTASALGIAGSFKELGDMLGPLLIGALTQAFGLKISFVTCGVIGLSSIGFLGMAAGARVEVEDDSL
jgi:MFS transporter, ACDE family, multidrug resistance protein